jgi:hypothetical protein
MQEGPSEELERDLWAMVTRPLIVGMDNPYSQNPKYALFPAPRNCTGWRLWQMLNRTLGVSRQEYVTWAERTNLCEGRWSVSAARQRWASLQSSVEGRDCVLLGRAVATAAGLPEASPLLWTDYCGGRVAMLPHPSGLNRWYNDPANMRMAESFMSTLYTHTTERV